MCKQINSNSFKNENTYYLVNYKSYVYSCMGPRIQRGCPRGVTVKAMDCGIVLREFVLSSRYYVDFRANTLGKSMNLLILPAMG